MIWNLWNKLLAKLAFMAPGGDTLRAAIHRLRGVKIDRNVWISQYVYIDELHPEAVTIHENVTIGLRTTIFTHFYWGPRDPIKGVGEVVIEKDVFVGPHCVILPNVRIGQGSVIKAGTVVTRNIPPRTFWGPPSAGPLAKVTVPLTSEYSYSAFMKGLKMIRRGKRMG